MKCAEPSNASTSTPPGCRDDKGLFGPRGLSCTPGNSNVRVFGRYLIVVIFQAGGAGSVEPGLRRKSGAVPTPEVPISHPSGYPGSMFLCLPNVSTAKL